MRFLPRTKLPVILFFAGGVLLIPILLLIFFLGPESPFLPRCLFHEWTRFYCPGCGGTRAVYSLLHGDFRGFFRNNPLLLPLLTVALLMWIFPRLSCHRLLCFSVVGVILAYWICRNLPFECLNILRPVLPVLF